MSENFLLASLKVDVGHSMVYDFSSNFFCKERHSRDLPTAYSLFFAEAISSRYKRFLPDLSCSLIGREKECDFIIDSLSSSQFRFGVIHGIPGVGKTSIAVKVGHIFVSKGWSVSYHDCRNGEFSKWLLTPFKKLHKTANSAINDTFPAENSLPTLLIFDQLGNVVNDELAKTPQGLKTLLDVAKDVDSFRLLIVSRKRLNFTCDNGFSLEVGSLSMTSAVKLLESYFQSRSKHHLELVAKGCGCNPLALTIISVIIEKGIPETQIIEKMSSPEQFWKILLHSAEMCQFSTKEQEGDPFEISDCGNSKTALQEKEGRYLFVKKANDLSEAKVSCNEKRLNCQWKLGLSSCEIDTLKTISNFQVSFKGTILLFFKNNNTNNNNNNNNNKNKHPDNSKLSLRSWARLHN